MNKRSNPYWDHRAMLRMSSYHRNGDRTMHVITSAYDRAIENLTGEIEAIFQRYAKNGNLSVEAAKHFLNNPLPQEEWNQLKNTVRYIHNDELRARVLSKLNANAYASRITRLEALREQAYIQSKIIADVELTNSTQFYIDTIKDAYYSNMFDVQRGLGVGFNFSKIPNKTIETILRNPWSGRQFSQRIWGNTDVLADQLSEIITGGFMSGLSVEKMREQLEELAGVGKHAANRLIRTETTYMSNAAELESYKEAGIDKYQFLATLDNRTSNQCREQDMKVYKVNEAVFGKNIPPLHAYCRSTTVAYFNKDTLDKIERSAVDPLTGKLTTVPANMSYDSWYKQYVA